MCIPLRLTVWIAPLAGAALALAPMTAMACGAAHVSARAGHGGGWHGRGWRGGDAWRAERMRQVADRAARDDLRGEGAFDWRWPQATETPDYTLQIEALGQALAVEEVERCARLGAEADAAQRAGARTAADARSRLRSLGCGVAD